MTCTDCPRGCAARGLASFCGVDRPGRLYWHGVTMLEEHELAPTYELWFTGCSLRCRFCTVPDAIEHPQLGTWLDPDALVAALCAATVPPFRAISLVGGDPTVNRPYVAALLPRLRQQLPGKLLALNTNLFMSPQLAARDASDFDWIVGDLHFWQPACARQHASAAAYPAAAVAAAEAVVQAGGRLMLRVLVLPGHLACCAAPSIAWACDLARRAQGRLRVHVMTHYGPAGRARGHAQLGRCLSPEERAAALALLGPDTPRPRGSALPGLPPRPPGALDSPAPIEIGLDGGVLMPFVTGELLPLAAALDPDVADRLAYLEPAVSSGA